jgi:hypothetical protein
MDEVKYIVVNLDVEEDQESWTGVTYGPFDEYEQAVDYGNRWMQFFGVNELNDPAEDD